MSKSKTVKPKDFFATHPVFRHEEFMEAHSGAGDRSPETTATVLKQHVAAGNLIHLRRGLYATVPPGLTPETSPLDPYLIATKIAEDTCVAYHAALQFHGKAYSHWRRYHVLTRTHARPLTLRGLELVPVRAPAALRSLPHLGGEIDEHLHAGGLVRVTSLERTLVDVLDAWERCGGWEEVWRSLEMVEYFDPEPVIDYTQKLGTALTAARVGFFLEQNRERLMIEESHLDGLQSLAPAQPRYMDTRRKPGKLVKKWNLIVPDQILARSWSAVP